MSSNTAWLFKPSFGTEEQRQMLLTAKSVAVLQLRGWGDVPPPLTCAEKQQDLHAQILVVGDLQTNKLIGDLQHLLALVSHVGQLHPLPGGTTSIQDPLVRLNQSNHSPRRD